MPEALDIIKPVAAGCFRHGGMQDIVRKLTSREVTNLILDLPLDYQPEDTDTPPF
jgi:hypothetical protein